MVCTEGAETPNSHRVILPHLIYGLRYCCAPPFPLPNSYCTKYTYSNTQLNPNKLSPPPCRGSVPTLRLQWLHSWLAQPRGSGILVPSALGCLGRNGNRVSSVACPLVVEVIKQASWHGWRLLPTCMFLASYLLSKPFATNTTSEDSFVLGFVINCRSLFAII